MSAAKRAEVMTQGAKLVEDLDQWFSSYMFFPEADTGLVLALWAIGSWCFDQFYSWPYLSITASTKGAGKSTLLNLLKLICRGASKQTAVRPFSLLKSIEARNGHMTLLFDESEDTSSEAKSFMSQVLNAGYTKGDTIERASGKELLVFDVYCPKAFSQIGDMASTMRDRAIVVTLARGFSERQYDADPEGAAIEGANLVDAIRLVLASGNEKPQRERLDFFANPRDAQIWGSMFGLANWLGITVAQRERLVRFASANAMGKTAPKRRAFAEGDEERAIEDVFSRKALKDVATVLDASGVNLPTAKLLDALLKLPEGGWMRYRGTGLDAIKLAALLSKFGLGPKAIRDGKGRQSRTVQGYKRADVQAALRAAGLGGVE